MVIPRKLAIACVLVGLSAAAQAEDPTIDRLLASHCAQCHGTDGQAVGDIDGLAGESFRDLRDKLQDMLFEDSAEDIMEHQAQGYTAEQLRRIAQYYASLPRGDGDDDGDDDEHDD